MIFAVQAARELCESLAVGSISLRHVQCENESYKIATEVNKGLPYTIKDIPTPKIHTQNSSHHFVKGRSSLKQHASRRTGSA